MTTRSVRRDDGVVLVIAALSMVALLLIVAIVIDLGYTRSDRRGAQLAVDNAAASAGQTMAKEKGDAVKACQTAIAYLEITLETAPFTGGACSSFSTCSNTNENVITLTSDGYTLRLEHPVLNTSSLMAGSSTIGNAGITVDTSKSADGLPCERFGVKVTTTGDSLFGGIAGSDKRVSSNHAVVRGKPNTNPVDVPAFLMLERIDCGALVDQNTQGGINVQASADGTQFGRIHADSFATGSCGGSDRDYVVAGTPLPDGSPSIRVQPSTTNPVLPGKITSTASLASGRAGGTYPGGLNVAPTPDQEIVGREVVDNKYNSAESPAISLMHDAAYKAVTISSKPDDFTALNSCTGGLSGVAKVWVECSSTYSGVGPFPDATEVVFSGGLSNGNLLTFPKAKRVTVKGSLALGNNKVYFPTVEELYVGANVTMGNNGGLAVKSSSELSCSESAKLVPTQFVVFGSSGISLNNFASLCGTTLYLAGRQTRPDGTPNNTYAIQTTTSTAVHATCATKTCPKTSTDATTGNQATGAEFAFGGNTTIVWSAPNKYGELPNGVLQGTEDLAFWSESAGTSNMGNNAVLKVSGVLFGPNMTFEVRSPSSAEPTNAQFIGRKLKLFQGGLNMQPTLRDSVEIPSAPLYQLIR